MTTCRRGIDEQHPVFLAGKRAPVHAADRRSTLAYDDLGHRTYCAYFTQRGPEVLILLAGGDKSTQAKDIKTALKLAPELQEKAMALKLLKWDTDRRLRQGVRLSHLMSRLDFRQFGTELIRAVA
ncbi:hypothetical protein GPA27_29115 [Aromatoleum toluolicum]|uniref:hypothetical protein n=1 Tax=Aromatoleum toluolicum TaxID=90060 RepID=UPI001B7D2735|nr:hypothetical protein [Aromatoleum toluolicum]MCQ6964056.1 hypothetical protein [Aromatoleum toluolicum]